MQLLQTTRQCKRNIINPRRTCARVTVIVLSVSVFVCFHNSGTSRNQAYKQQYQRLQRDTGMKYKKGFFFKTLRSEVMASFTHNYVCDYSYLHTYMQFFVIKNNNQDALYT